MSEQPTCCAPTCCPTETKAHAQTKNTTHEDVRSAYGKIAASNGAGCCGPSSAHLGYAKEDLAALPDGADLGLGCGNPGAFATLKSGERVLDLGCGAGIDALLAARAVGETGFVVGVDMTREMLAKARKNVVSADMSDRVDIREGKIEALPVRDGEVDVVISNCVINLSPDKQTVFHEAFRALAPGGRLAVSDILLTEPLPESVQKSVAAWVGCVAGAELADDYLGAIEEAGFVDVAFTRTLASGLLEIAEQSNVIPDLDLPEATRARLRKSVYSYSITATKPS